jgi:hypothetical protein
MSRLLIFALLALVFAAGVLITGCGTQTPPAAVPPAHAAKEAVAGKHDQEEHGHAKGVVAMGDYHGKLLVEPGGKLRLVILGKDETKETSIESQEIQGHLQVVGAAESAIIVLTPEATASPGSKTSQFLGQVPAELQGKPLQATLRISIAGEAYRPTFETAPGSARHDEHALPPPDATSGSAELTDKEKDLYLTPGGIYTAQDIEKNGRTAPRLKFKGLEASHEDPQTGDRICPISKSKASDNFRWWVGGKEYKFCCPPCVRDFVRLAKEQPDKIKEPASYVK